MPIFAPLALTASTAALLAIPLAPALRELFTKQDAGPLVTRKDDGRIDNFARSMRERYRALQPLLSHSAQQNEAQTVETRSGELLLVERTSVWSWGTHIDKDVFCSESIQLPEQFHCTRDFYCVSDAFCGRNSLFRTLLSEASIELGVGTQVLRWIHAERNLEISPECRLFGRASAGQTLVLSSGAKFERISAPTIYSSSLAATLAVRRESAAFAKLAQAGIGRTRRLGRIRLEAEEQHFGDLVATRSLELHERASVFGSVKANGDIVVNESAEVEGSVVATKSVQVAQGCFIKGPLISEEEIVIGPGVQVGLPDSPTTVSAPRIRIAPGSVFHGTVWARGEGRVGV